MAKQVHKSGELAYFDSFSGLIKCKVTSITQPEDSFHRKITFSITTKRWKQTEMSCESSELWVIPRESVYTKGGRYIIRNNYIWQPD